MNFFEAQDKARRNTFHLVLLFALAVIGLIMLTNLLLLCIYAYTQTEQVVDSAQGLFALFSWQQFALVSGGVCLFVLAGSLYKMATLSGGGAEIAQRLGGKLVPQSTRDAQQRRLLNVVEEMAIAAGMSIPQVYLLEDTSINAFAAGSSPGSAVIGITRGALQRLNREELQGVIAHEFSHIANGDMRLNIRLIGILHGILLIGLMGYFLFRSIRYTRSSSNNKAAGGIMAIVALGIGLMIIGYAGSFFGQCIKAVVSRQREYLADSSAVQFTRNKDGIAGALKKIGGGFVGSQLSSPAAPEYSHAYFANGVSGFFQSLLATHPPLEDRIKRIEPRWDGEFLISDVQPSGTAAEPEPEAETAAGGAAGLAQVAVPAAVLSSVEQAIGEIGSLNEQNIDYVHGLLLAMPMVLRDAAQDPLHASAVIYAALVCMQKDEAAAYAELDANVSRDLVELVRQFAPEIKNLDARSRFPLLELGASALRESSPNQYVHFKMVVEKVIASDKSINLREWVVQRFLLQQLDEYFGFRKPVRAKHDSLDALSQQVTVILSLIARIEHNSEAAANHAFQSGIREAGLESPEMLAVEAFNLSLLDAALDELMKLKPLAKPRLLKACVAIVLADDKPTTTGIELVRTISTCLNCPMPPLRAAAEDISPVN